MSLPYDSYRTRMHQQRGVTRWPKEDSAYERREAPPTPPPTVREFKIYVQGVMHDFTLTQMKAFESCYWVECKGVAGFPVTSLSEARMGLREALWDDENGVFGD